MRVTIDLTAAGLLALGVYVVTRDHHTRRALDTLRLTMTPRTEFDAVIGRINASTNGIAERLRALEEKVTNAGLPADVEQEVLAELELVAGALEAIAANPEDPTPEIPE